MKQLTLSILISWWCVSHIQGQEFKLLLKNEVVSSNCVQLSAANGIYHFNLETSKIQINGFRQIIPKNNFSDDQFLKLYGLQYELKDVPSIELDAYSYVEFPCDSFDSRYRQFMNWDPSPIENFLILQARDNPEKLAHTPFLITSPQIISELSDTLSTSGIIDGAISYKRGSCYQNEHFTLTHRATLDSLEKVYSTYRDSVITPKIEPLFQPFFLGQFELTNKEYNDFKNWVIDSLFLETVYRNCDDLELSSTLLNCTKKQLKDLDVELKEENRARYGLKCPDKSMSEFRSNEEYIPYMVELYIVQPQRYYKRRELNPKLWNYKMNNQKSVAIAPDSLKFLNFRTAESDFLTCAFHWHPIYNSFPIVNISYEQAEAFCHWKTNQLQDKFKNKGLKVKVEIPALHEYELALKTIVPEANSLIYDLSNENYFLEQRNFDDQNMIEIWFKKVANNEPMLMKKEYQQQAFEYNQWLSANYFEGLNFINGNVSEYCSTPITEELLEMNNIPRPEGALENYVLVLGSNYEQDVKSKAGSNVNTIFYKTIQKRTDASSTTGVRLVLRVESL